MFQLFECYTWVQLLVKSIPIQQFFAGDGRVMRDQPTYLELKFIWSLVKTSYKYKKSVETGNIGVIHTVTHKREKKNAYGRVSSASSQSFCNKNFANFTWVALAHYLIVFLAVNGCSISAHGVSAPGNDAFLIERQTCIETSDILTHCRELKMINSLSVQKGTQVCNRGTKWRMKMA